MPYKDPERQRINGRKWARANAGSVRISQAKYRKTNRKKIKAYNKARYDAHKARLLQWHHRRWKTKKAEVSGANKRWARANREKIRTYCVKRRAIAAKATGPHHTPAQRRALFEKYKGKCAYCPRKATTLDHVIPLSRGGSNGIRNCAPACRHCNSSKGSKLLSEWLPARQHKQRRV